MVLVAANDHQGELADYDQEGTFPAVGAWRLLSQGVGVGMGETLP